MKLLQKIGFGLFMLGFILFLSTLSMNKYQLTDTVNRSVLKNQNKDIQQWFSEESVFFKGQVFDSKFGFIEVLDTTFSKVNKKVVQQYGIEVDLFISQLLKVGKSKGFTYDEEMLNATKEGLQGDQLNSQEQKIKAVKDYTSWMFGKDFGDANVFRSELTDKISSANNGIVSNKGIPDYEQKKLKFQFVKQASIGLLSNFSILFLFLSIGLISIGGVIYILPNLKRHPGINNDGIFTNVATSLGWLGFGIGILLVGFYVCLYWYPEYITNWVTMVDPLAMFLKGKPADQWFLYGFLYCVSMSVMGVRMFVKYRHNRYQLVRTFSVIYFQLIFAFLIPQIMEGLNVPSADLKNMWPLDYGFFFDYRLDHLLKSGGLGVFLLVWGILLFTVGVPVMVYFFGKRWYCSWVCGCGGLAETVGDPFRQLSSKKLGAWQFERYSIHIVLVFAVIMTVGVLYTYFTGSHSILGIVSSDQLRSWYGFGIGAAFAGVVGTGFYPILGNRSWCRFGCPLAAYLGLVQRFKSRYRITTNGGQCISCGNCSTYCEMGIDVRWYAQRSQDIVRSSCVGCGVCSAVCPRGVLNLENSNEPAKTEMPAIIIGRNEVRINIEK